MYVLNKFRLDDKVAIITGGAGLLGVQHADVIMEMGGKAVIWDIDDSKVTIEAKKISERFEVKCIGMTVDITNPDKVKKGLKDVVSLLGKVDVLINNAANNPKVKQVLDKTWTHLENFSLDMWNNDIAVGLTGAFICSQLIGTQMAQQGSGVILNIASDLGVIAPDQRIYQKDGLEENEQFVKPVTYSVIKHGLIGLTKYLATYWANKKVRVNTLCPGGVYNNQPEDFVEKLTNLIPMGRMAKSNEYKAAVLFMISEASSYMTGSTVIIDGGRTCW